MSDPEVKRIIEALLFVMGQPVALKRLAEVLQEVPAEQIRGLIQALNQDYAAQQRAFQIQEVAGGYQLVTDQQLAPWIKRALQGHKPDAVSKAALETLAIVAYRQPITKAEIEAIRGVDVTASLDALIERRFLRVAGRKESPGRPFLYATTTEFLRHFGLRSLDALPRMEQPTVSEPVAAGSPSTAPEEPRGSSSSAAGSPEASQNHDPALPAQAH